MSPHQTKPFRKKHILPSLKSTKITEHVFETNHGIYDYSFKIMGRAKEQEFKILEFISINKFRTLNSFDSSVGLNIER